MTMTPRVSHPGDSWQWPALAASACSPPPVIARAENGDERTLSEFEQVVRDNHERIYRAACLLLSDPAEAEDMTQIVFVEAWRGWLGFERRSQPYTWLYRILLRKCRRHQRRLGWLRRWCEVADLGTAKALEQVADDRPAPDAVACRRDDRAELRAVMRGMSPKLREVLVLRYLEDWPLSQIADTLGLPVGTVKSRLALAQNVVAQRLQAKGWK
jgi:RNA polymerase sigma-70 factor (ECF subfamily)